MGGGIQVQRRLGCIGCPLAYKNKRVEQFRQYPGFLRLYIKNAQVWYDNHKDVPDMPYRYAIDKMARELFYVQGVKGNEKFMADTYTMFGKKNWKKHLEEVFKVDLSGIPYDLE